MYLGRYKSACFLRLRILSCLLLVYYNRGWRLWFSPLSIVIKDHIYKGIQASCNICICVSNMNKLISLSKKSTSKRQLGNNQYIILTEAIDPLYVGVEKLISSIYRLSTICYEDDGWTTLREIQVMSASNIIPNVPKENLFLRILRWIRCI